MAKVLTQSKALNLYFESVLWMTCPHANKIPDAMLAYVLAACRNSDAIPFENWCEACNIQIAPDKEGTPERKQEYISPLTDIADRRGEAPAFHASQSEMSEEDIIKHNEAALCVVDSFPGVVSEKPQEPNNDAALEHASADRSGV